MFVLIFIGSAAESGSTGFGAPSAFGNQGGQTVPGQNAFGSGQGNNFGGSGSSGGGGQCTELF